SDGCRATSTCAGRPNSIPSAARSQARRHDRSSFGGGPWCRRVVEDWLHVTLEERKRLVASIFELITLDDTGELDCTPCESWKDYARAIIPATTANERP